MASEPTATGTTGKDSELEGVTEGDTVGVGVGVSSGCNVDSGSINGKIKRALN